VMVKVASLQDGHFMVRLLEGRRAYDKARR